MLLKARTRTIDYKTALELWEFGGRMRLVRAPFDPFYYATWNPQVGHVEKLSLTPLSTMQKRTMYKVSFPNTYVLKDKRVRGGIEDDVPYDQRVAINLGFKFPSNVEPTLDSFDLEMDTKFGFPDANRDKIIAIGYEGDNYAECPTIFDEPEYELIHWLDDTIRKRNPDLPSTYFGSFADWDWLSTRASINGIKLNVGRDKTEPYFRKRTFRSGKKVGEDVTVDIGGRVHFDVWKEVAQDQTLFGIKNRQLKTVAEWFGIPVVKVDRSTIHELNAEELSRYCQSDAHATRELALLYIRNLFPLGEYFEIPLNMVIERSPSHPSNYLYMRRFHQLGIVADANNAERYPDFTFEGRKTYQGALITLMKAGVFFDIKHLDFKSMYPAINIVHNYSPENIYNVHVHKGHKMKEWVEYDGEKISVYDKYLGIVTVKVRLDKDSVTKEALKYLWNWRKEVRKDKSDAAYSQQWAIKVIMNSIPGYHGMGFARCGCYPIAAHTTGHGRYWIDKATGFLFQKPDTVPIERDTDGIYYISDHEYSADVQELIRALIPKQFDPDYIRVANDDYPAGIFYEDKGYVLKKSDGKLLFHGSGLKGRHLPRACDKAAEVVVNAIFEQDDIAGLLNEIGADLSSLPQEDFVMTTQLKKHPDSYSTKNQYGKLIQRCKAHGVEVRWGDEIQYVKTKDKSYLPLGLTRDFSLDYRYYRGRIANVLERLLQVSHGYTRKSILTYLEGGRTLGV